MKKFAVHRRASHLRPAARRVRAPRRRRLSADGHRRGHVLPLEEEVRQLGRARGARAPTDARGECATEAARRGSHPRQADPSGGAAKKALKPARRRELAQWVRDRYQVSCRRVCALTDICPTTWYYKSQARDTAALRMRIREIAQARPRFGYTRIWIMLRREGWRNSKKHVHRLYRLEGLQVRMRRPPQEAAQPGARRATARKWARSRVEYGLRSRPTGHGPYVSGADRD